MHRLCAALALAAAAAHAADQGGDAGMFDLLGGASWQERRAELVLGRLDLDVDGVRDDQTAWYASVGASAVSGYRAGERPVGGILGLGAAAKLWWGNDDVDVRALAPFALGVAGVFATINERTRGDLTARLGPGLSWARIGDESDMGFAWMWSAEATVTVTQGDGAGVGIGAGYESVHLEDFTQEGIFVLLRVGF